MTMRYTLDIRAEGGGGTSISIEADTDQEAMDQVQDEVDGWMAEGDWGDDGASVESWATLTRPGAYRLSPPTLTRRLRRLVEHRMSEAHHAVSEAVRGALAGGEAVRVAAHSEANGAISATTRSIVAEIAEIIEAEVGEAAEAEIVLIDDESYTTEIEPNHEVLMAAAGAGMDCEHEWTSEGEGGCTENPGVWSCSGTGMKYRTHCRHCGLRRIEYSTGAQKNPGDHDTVRYEMPDTAEHEDA